MGCIETFLIDLSNISKGNTDIIKYLIIESFNAHMVKGFIDMLWSKDNTPFLSYLHSSLNDC